MTTAFFIFGFGYTANRLAEKLIQLGFAVVGTTRQERKKTTNHSPVLPQSIYPHFD